MMEAGVLEEDEIEIEAEIAALSLTKFKKDVQDLAAFYIDKFFEGRQMHYGGPIPAAVLRSPAYVEMVQTLDIERGVQQAYDLISRSQQVSLEVDEQNVPEDVKMVVSILQECASCGIPKCFASGILLMNLEICMGIQLPKSFAYSGFGRG